MAKTLLKDYIFEPGLGALDNLYPNGYNLLADNKTFIQKENNAFISDRIQYAKQFSPSTASYEPTTGILDITLISATLFTPTNASYDPTTGFINLTLGVGHGFNIGDYIRIADESLTFTCGYDDNATEHSYPRTSNVPNINGTDPSYNRNLKITNVGIDYITVNIGVSSDTSTHTFVSATANAISTSHNLNVGDAIILAPGSFRFICQLDGGLSTHNYPRVTDPAYNKALIILSATATNITVNVGISSDTSQHSIVTIQSNAVSDVFYNYVNDSETKCERDVGYIIDSYLFDIRYGGNEKTYKSISYYWEEDVAQVDGNRGPELVTHYFIRNLINNYILQNKLFPKLNLTESQQLNTNVIVESNFYNRITELSQNVIDVISNGTSSLPTLVKTGLGHVIFKGNYSVEDLLIITNVTKNIIIYNFASNETGGYVDIIKNGNDYFITYDQRTDAITKLNFNYDTSNQSATDELQIFIEKTENAKSVVTVRPYDFGTDAIERQRIAPPLSMLDADFEYGLQPTKWAAIGTLRGYPSIYEVPGTDTEVKSMVTDASAGTNGVGQSLITVTTVTAHGFSIGTPITIKALEDSIIGAARAEGSFVINNVPSTTTFTYYAKSKVGTSNGQVLSNTYTQLRQAGFYTGASIGSPEFIVLTNGAAGTVVSELIISAGSTIIPYDGLTPGIGSPVNLASFIPTGAQVTGYRDTSSGGGTYITPEISGDFINLTDTITVVDPTGIVLDLAIDRGNGVAIYVNSIVGNSITFTDPFVIPIIGNSVSYDSISAQNVFPTGTDAVFTIARTGGAYSVTIISDGSGYNSGDKINIPGTFVGGLSPTHDLLLTVNTTISTGSIDTFSQAGTAFDGTGSTTVTAPPAEGGQGSGAIFDITLSNSSYTAILNPSDDSTGYTPGDKIVFDGATFGGTTGTNDASIVVNTILSSGAIDTFTISGTGPDAVGSFPSPPFANVTTIAGIDAVFDVTFTGTTYNATIFNPGINYQNGDLFTISGADLGGTSPANDCQISVTQVDPQNGAIQTFSVSGTAINSVTIPFQSGTNIIGSGLILDVTLNAGQYTVAINNAGSNYTALQQIIIPGSLVIGQDGINDLTIIINTVDTAGSVLTLTESGTAAGGTGTYYEIAGTNVPPFGSGALFNILRENNDYTTITLQNGGSQYQQGDRLIILGSTLGGETPLNDIEISISTVNAGTVTGFTTNYIEAAHGSILNLISTFSISEQTLSQIAKNTSITFDALATLEIEFPYDHGLVPGDTFIVDISSDDGVNNHIFANGSFFATSIPSISKVQYQARAAANIDDSVDAIQGTVYPRPDSFFIHRPYDGGVQLGTGGPQHGAQAIRQSKKYIRYQSGKGIMYTTGALFAPSYDLRSVQAAGIERNSLITVVTDDNDHGLQEGGIVRLSGIITEGFNSGSQTAVPPEFDYTVVNIIDERTFQIRSQRRLGATSAVLSSTAQVSVVSWHGATVRSGIFDDQNGIFWEFDGTQISVVQRTGTKQLSGTISIGVDSNLLQGINTKFTQQITAGDRIIIKGMTHTVSNIVDDVNCYITPDFRGVTSITAAKASLIIDKKVKQKDFNIDKLDGTGPSRYDIDITKMQMIGIQYSWYGAGFIDFMLRGSDGNFIFAHRMRNSNVNTEAFMRSGNLPVRYEVTNEGPPGKLAENMTISQLTIPLYDSSFFPTSGYVYIDNEIIYFANNNKDTNTLTDCIRATDFQNFQAGANRTYSAGIAATHSADTGVILISQTITPLISHWGSAFLTDGGFDEDRGYIFSYTETSLPVDNIKRTAFMIRLAPSVSNAIIGDLGERELLNRAQLLLQSLEITSDGYDTSNNPITGGIVVEGVINPQNYPSNPANVVWNGLSNVAQGGQPSFAQIASSGGITWTSGTQSVNVNITIISDISVSVTSAEFNNDNQWRITRSSYDAAEPLLGGSVAGGSISSNNIWQNVTSTLSNVGRIRQNTVEVTVTDDPTLSMPSGTVTSFTVQGTISNASYAYFTKASVDTGGVKVGDNVAGTGGVTFPANSQISSIQAKQHGSTEFYQVNFNNSFSGTLTPGNNVVVTQEAPSFAQPGETVFSLVSVPGERAVADFKELKELTNTPLGGRGTYPNGPDVLAVNIYKVGGTATSANIQLRWGEAQA